MKGRILTVEDEKRWLENFQSLIPDDLATLDTASTSTDAVTLLRRFHYDLVLLDLSMDSSNPLNRDNRPIQEYLAARPEGTLYIVVSLHAQAPDVRDAAFRLGAWDVIFKDEIDLEGFSEKIARALATAAGSQQQRLNELRTRMIEDQLHDNQLLMSLKPHGGASSMYSLLDAVFRGIAPIGQHREREYFFVTGPCVCGLVWSRRLGAAVSIALANKSVKEETILATLADWMGFPHRGECVVSREMHRVGIRIFDEPSITDTHFDLPSIDLGK